VSASAYPDFQADLAALEARHAERKQRAAQQAASIQRPAVIGQYLTVGGATVDITDESHSDRITITCLGCTWTTHEYLRGIYTDTPDQTAQRVAENLPTAREQAQAHASTCRAMPLPKPDAQQ
jgi:hypothetical protein